MSSTSTIIYMNGIPYEGPDMASAFTAADMAVVGNDTTDIIKLGGALKRVLSHCRGLLKQRTLRDGETRLPFCNKFYQEVFETAGLFGFPHAAKAGYMNTVAAVMAIGFHAGRTDCMEDVLQPNSVFLLRNIAGAIALFIAAFNVSRTCKRGVESEAFGITLSEVCDVAVPSSNVDASAPLYTAVKNEFFKVRSVVNSSMAKHCGFPEAQMLVCLRYTMGHVRHVPKSVKTLRYAMLLTTLQGKTVHAAPSRNIVNITAGSLIVDSGDETTDVLPMQITQGVHGHSSGMIMPPPPPPPQTMAMATALATGPENLQDVAGLDALDEVMDNVYGDGDGGGGGGGGGGACDTDKEAPPVDVTELLKSMLPLLPADSISTCMPAMVDTLLGLDLQELLNYLVPTAIKHHGLETFRGALKRTGMDLHDISARPEKLQRQGSEVPDFNNLFLSMQREDVCSPEISHLP
jgi:hypothetical protein